MPTVTDTGRPTCDSPPVVGPAPLDGHAAVSGTRIPWTFLRVSPGHTKRRGPGSALGRAPVPLSWLMAATSRPTKRWYRLRRFLLRTPDLAAAPPARRAGVRRCVLAVGLSPPSSPVRLGIFSVRLSPPPSPPPTARCPIAGGTPRPRSPPCLCLIPRVCSYVISASGPQT